MTRPVTRTQKSFTNDEETQTLREIFDKWTGELPNPIDEMMEKLSKYEKDTEYIPYYPSPYPYNPWSEPYKNPWVEPYITWQDNNTGSRQ